MSNFGQKLAELMERNKTYPAEISRLTGISDVLMSRWIGGKQTFVSADDLAKLCGYISSDPKQQAELVKAHLLDELGAPGSELISISIKGQVSYLKENSPKYRTALPLDVKRALDILGSSAVTDADVRAVILGLASVVEPKLTEET